MDPTFHTLFDHDDWLLLPELAVLQDVSDAVQAVISDRAKHIPAVDDEPVPWDNIVLSKVCTLTHDTCKAAESL